MSPTAQIKDLSKQHGPGVGVGAVAMAVVWALVQLGMIDGAPAQPARDVVTMEQFRAAKDKQTARDYDQDERFIRHMAGLEVTIGKLTATLDAIRDDLSER